jgi:ABC-2 type transport system ATP-binding protein
MGTGMVQATGLSRAFDARLAVDDVSLTVQAGEVLVLLGPNGAGKTTTFRMLAGLLMPTRGTVSVAGETLASGTADRVRRRVGLLTEAPGLWERLSVRVNLQTYARLHGVAEPVARVARLMDEVGIADRADDRAGSLSKGLKQRAALARALVHDPPVVLLDEPTAGLDPASARHVRDLVHALRREGRTVLVSTHNLAEAEELADRIAVMNGRLLACDTPHALRAGRRDQDVALDLEGGAQPWIGAISEAGATVLRIDGDRAVVRTGDGRAVPDLVAALVTAGARIRRVAPREQSLEDTYLDLVDRDG